MFVVDPGVYAYREARILTDKNSGGTGKPTRWRLNGTRFTYTGAGSNNGAVINGVDCNEWMFLRFNRGRKASRVQQQIGVARRDWMDRLCVTTRWALLVHGYVHFRFALPNKLTHALGYRSGCTRPLNVHACYALHT